MRMSKLMLKTLREAPSEAELESHNRLLRAGLVTSLAAGLYAFTPLGWRVLRKVEGIIRDEMDGIGAQEVRLPELNPIELWEQSGRAGTMGQTLFRLADRKERGFVLGPTHEEGMSYLASRHIQSYRDLPVTLYQIETKFRDEPRPRGGLVRLREFTMKDAYSFDAGWEALDASYAAAYDAYVRIFARAGVPVIPVAADSGAIGGKESQEFVFLTDDGEDEILLCPQCGYAANAEKAEFAAPAAVPANALPMERVATPGQKTIAGLAQFLGIEERQTVKAVLHEYIYFDLQFDVVREYRRAFFQLGYVGRIRMGQGWDTKLTLVDDDRSSGAAGGKRYSSELLLAVGPRSDQREAGFNIVLPRDEIYPYSPDFVWGFNLRYFFEPRSAGEFE